MAQPAHPAPGLAALLVAPTRFLFFTGKGGVGKTSLACATAIALADGGKQVLLVSTDPASNLDEVLGQKLNGAPTPIPGADGLRALNIDPEAAAQAYRDRIVGPVRGKLPEAIVRSMEEQLSGACTMEIAAFDEFARLLGEPAATADFDHVIFDTAPTGHTLRLMTLPTAWSGFLAWVRWRVCRSSGRSTKARSPRWPTARGRLWSWSAARKKPPWTKRNAPAANWPRWACSTNA